MSEVITTTVSNDSLTSMMNSDTLNDSYNTIVKQINNGYKFVYGNTVLSAVLGMILILYSAKAAPELPNALNKLFDIPLFKIVFMFLLAYITSKDPSVALITAIILYLSIQALSYYEASMKIKCNKNKLSPSEKYLPRDVKLTKSQAKLLNLFLKHSEKLNKKMKVETFANTDILDDCRREAFTVDAIVDKSLTTIQNNIAVSNALNNGDAASAKKHMDEINKTNTELSLLLQSQLSSAPAPERLVKDILTTLNTSPASVTSAINMTTSPLDSMFSNNVGQLPTLLSPSPNSTSPSPMSSLFGSLVTLVTPSEHFGSYEYFSPSEQSSPAEQSSTAVQSSPAVQVVSLLPNSLTSPMANLNSPSMPVTFVSPSDATTDKVNIPNMLSEIKNILSTSPFVSTMSSSASAPSTMTLESPSTITLESATAPSTMILSPSALSSAPAQLSSVLELSPLLNSSSKLVASSSLSQQVSPASADYLLAPATNKVVSPVITLPSVPTSVASLPTQQALVNISPVITLPNTPQSQLTPVVNIPSLPPVASLPEPVVNVQTLPISPVVTKPVHTQTKPSLQTVTTLAQMVYQSEPNPIDNELYATYESKEDNTLLGNCMPAYTDNNNMCAINNSSINGYDSNNMAVY